MKNFPDWLRLIKGNIEADDEEPVDILLAEPIGFDPATYRGMSSKEFGYALNSISKKKPVRLLINSLGGSHDEGVAIHNMTLARGNVTTCVIGYAASAAATIFQAGKVRQMMPGTMMVIHNPMNEVSGDHRDMRKLADRVEQVKVSLVDLLSSRTGQSKKKISDMMDETTMMDPKDAKEMGFCDEVVDGSATWNDLAKEVSPSKALTAFLQLTGSVAKGAAADTTKNQADEPQMKSLLAALVAAGLIDAADTTDEQASARFNERIKNRIKDGVPADEVTGLRNRITQFENAQKTRVEDKVNLAVTNKLVKEDRKAALIAMGTRDEAELDATLADLQTLRNEVQPAGTRRGAPPVPPKAEGESETETKIAGIKERMKNCTPAESVTLARELRELRGHKNLFQTAAK